MEAKSGLGREWFAEPYTWKAYRKWALSEEGGDMSEAE